ncbi:MAG: sulfatase [Bacteroidota bacterium]
MPNILLFLADDMTWRDCSVYGNPDVSTPNIQRMADEGITFHNMFTGTAMCAPTRQQIFTGLFPVRSGAYPNHSMVYDGVRSIAYYFKEKGYEVALIGKQHYGPKASFPFTYLGGRGSDDGKGMDIALDHLDSIFESDRPFVVIVAQNQPHLPWNRGDSSLYNPNTLDIPDYMVDTEFTRTELTKYYAEITYMDDLLGECLDKIKSSGKENNTISIFTSEQGSTHPFAKWTCYDLGLKTGFIAKWPGKIERGNTTSAMCQYVDVVPTLLDLIGEDPDSIDTGICDGSGYRGFDGKSFKNVLLGKTEHHGEFVFGIHTTVGVKNGSPSYPIRSVRNNNYKYIKNLNHEVPFQNNETELEGRHFGNWIQATKDSTELYDWVRKYQFRPAEELYDIINDPWEKNNLANAHYLTQEKAKLSKALDIWMKQQGDLGEKTELNATSRIHK